MGRHHPVRWRSRACRLAVILLLTAATATPGAGLALAETRTSDSSMSRYLVQITGVPVALQGAQGGHDDAARRELRGVALADAAPIEEAVVALGGSVRATYVDVVRVLAVSLPADRVAALQGFPGVVRVEPVRVHRGAQGRTSTVRTRDAGRGSTIRILGSSPAPWARLGWTGRGVRIAILDTGVDYTHADFGGVGTPQAYASNDGTTIESGSFPTAKVITGYDFVGDAYDADSADPAARVPVPDPDPLDCQGHGTHVAGSAAGFGVTADGSTFRGPNDAKAIAGLAIPPGTAPDALLMAYRVFGCEGDNDSEVVVASIDRAVADGADVINMSMGREFGTEDNIEALAADNAVKAGVVVVASAGNSGPEPYLVGAPSSGTRVLSIAALDPVIRDPGGSIDAATDREPVLLRLANDVALPVTGPIRVLRDGQGGIALGCAAADYAGSAGTVVVVARGVCPRIDRPAFAQAAGAVGVILVNDSAIGRPPAEGAIPNVTIPFLGARQADAAALLNLDGRVREIRAASVPNETARQPTNFTSAGPRTGDAAVKPNLAAPGARIVSAASGGGSTSATFSGTSMSSPYVAGVAAVLRQAHPTWTSEEIGAALSGTASVSRALLAAPDRRLIGTGVVDPVAAIRAPVLVLGPRGAYGVSFGVREYATPVAQQAQDPQSRTVQVWNPSGETRRVRLDVRPNGRVRATFAVSTPDLVLEPGQRRTVRITMLHGARLATTDPVAESGSDSPPNLAAATLVATVDGRVASRVLIQGLPLDRAAIQAQQTDGGAITVTNGGRVAGTARPFTWILADDREGSRAADLRAIGIRWDPSANPASAANDRIVTFAINQYERFSNPARNRYTIQVDADNDGQWDHALLGVDEEFFDTGNDSTAGFNGVFVARAVDLTSTSTNSGDPTPAIAGVATAPLNGSTVLLSAPASAIGISGAHPAARFRVSSESFVDATPGLDSTDEVTVTFGDAPPSGESATLKPSQKGTLDSAPVLTGSAGRGSLGTMVVVLENSAGPDQARLLPAAP